MSTFVSAAEKPEELISKDTLNVDIPPFIYYENGEMKGIDIEIAKELAKDLFGDSNKIKIHPVLVSHDRIPSLLKGDGGIILAVLTKTKWREKAIYFASPYLKISLGLMTLKGGEKISSLSKLEGKNVGVAAGSVAENYLRNKHQNVNLMLYQQHDETYPALLKQEVDAVVSDNMLLMAQAKENDQFEISIPSFGDIDFIVPALRMNESEAVKQWLEKEIKTMKEDGRLARIYDEVLKAYFGNDFDPTMFSVIE